MPSLKQNSYYVGSILGPSHIGLEPLKVPPCSHDASAGFHMAWALQELLWGWLGGVFVVQSQLLSRSKCFLVKYYKP